MKFPRSAGVLLHISSLPGSLGIGDLGPQAREFAHFLKRAGQTIWQILPVCPPAAGNSPYSSFSVFASNASLISPEDMIQNGWGTHEDLQNSLNENHGPDPTSNLVDYPLARSIRDRFFYDAFRRICEELPNLDNYQDFCDVNRYWLEDFALYESLAQTFGSLDWSQWPSPLSQRKPEAIADYQKEHGELIEYSRFLQFVFDFQWQQLRSLCNGLGIRIYGDLPIFVDYQSADVWANQELFQLNNQGSPEFVAGVPPDYFSEMGQKWGNPLYRWDVMEKDGFGWWTKRFRRSLEQFDLIRVDHFRGFESYWRIPANAPDATTGEWVKGPGEKPFHAARVILGDLPIVAEDLGLITEEVSRLRESLDFPTMRVMQFGYASEQDNFHRPEQYPTHCFAYTGTHDNDTILGWFKHQVESGTIETRELLKREFNTDFCSPEEIRWRLIRAVLNSQADTAIVPLQDYLGLGSQARMNLPGTVKGNWLWKLGTNDSWVQQENDILRETQKSRRV